MPGPVENRRPVVCGLANRIEVRYMFRMISAPPRSSRGDASLPPRAPVRRRPSLLPAGTTSRSLPGFASFAPFPVPSPSKGCEISSTENKGFLQAIRVTLVYFRPAPHDAFHASNLSTLPTPKRVQASISSTSPAQKRVQASISSTLPRPPGASGAAAATPPGNPRLPQPITFRRPSSTVQRNFAKRGKLFYNQDKALPLSGHRFRIERHVPCLSRRRS